MFAVLIRRQMVSRGRALGIEIQGVGVADPQPKGILSSPTFN
jgi:hypothetical protein